MRTIAALVAALLIAGPVLAHAGSANTNFAAPDYQHSWPPTPPPAYPDCHTHRQHSASVVWNTPWPAPSTPIGTSYPFHTPGGGGYVSVISHSIGDTLRGTGVPELEQCLAPTLLTDTLVVVSGYLGFLNVPPGSTVTFEWESDTVNGFVTASFATQSGQCGLSWDQGWQSIGLTGGKCTFTLTGWNGGPFYMTASSNGVGAVLPQPPYATASSTLTIEVVGSGHSDEYVSTLPF